MRWIAMLAGPPGDWGALPRPPVRRAWRRLRLRRRAAHFGRMREAALINHFLDAIREV